MNNSLQRVLIAAIFLFSASTTVVQAATVTINSTVHGSLGDGSHGNPLDGVIDGVFPTSVSLSNTIFQELRGIIEFDLSSLPGTVTSASLLLTRTHGVVGSTRVMDLFGYTGNGIFEVADYTPGSLINSFDILNAPTELWDVTAFINAQLTAADSLQFAGLRVEWSGAPVFESISFGTNASNYPQLMVEFASPVPLPAALPLFAGGLGLLGLLGWRRKRMAAA